LEVGPTNTPAELVGTSAGQHVSWSAGQLVPEVPLALDLTISITFRSSYQEVAEVPRRLALQLILSLTVIVGIVAAVTSYINVRTQEDQLLNAMILGADQLSNGITSATWHAMLADDRNSAYEVMETIAEKQGISRIRIFNREGRIMFSTRPEENNQTVDKGSEACALCHSSLKPILTVDPTSRARIFPDPDGDRKLAMVTPIYNEPACSQAACHAHPAEIKVLGVLDVDLDLQTVDDQLSLAKWRTFLFTLIHILLIGIFIVLFTRRFVAVPIRRLIEGTRAVAQMQLDKPIRVTSSEELGELASSFNTMRERLKEALDEINQFTASLETKVRERTQQLHIAHRKLLQADRLASLGQLSASVAHEINNPVSGVLNLSMLMQRILKDDGIPPGRLAEFRKYQAQVISETARVGRIVSDLLAFSRRSKPHTSMGDLNKILENTVSLVSHKLKLANVSVETHFAADLPELLCDGSQMQQVVMNLIMNAAEATHNKGTGKVILRTFATNEGIVLEVEDNGEGIAPELQTKIFDPFFTTKEEGKGVGLGLAVVYGIIRAHGGDIEFQSVVGKGTTFRVTLPLGEETRGGGPAAPEIGQPV